MERFVLRTKRKRDTSRQANESDKTEKRRKFPEDCGVTLDGLPQGRSTSTDSAISEENTRPTSSQVPTLSSYAGLSGAISWRAIRSENLSCDYCRLLSRAEELELLRACEEGFTYNTGRAAQVQLFGQWRDIPRKQVAFGDPGLSYAFSGSLVPALPWPAFLGPIRDVIAHATGHRFNFVLVNRYKNGDDYIGEHRDDEKDMVASSPIASLSIGQTRDMVFRHAASRRKGASSHVLPVTVALEGGSLLVMNHPTNVHWYHSLPKRKRALGVRVNMTFRDLVTDTKKRE